MKRAEIAGVLVRAKRLAKQQGAVTLMTQLGEAIKSLNTPLAALVVREGDTGDGGVIKVILTPEIPANLADLCEYGCQCAEEIGPDECDSAEEVEEIFNEMNPPAEEEEDDGVEGVFE